jgi:hypothetical protein
VVRGGVEPPTFRFSEGLLPLEPYGTANRASPSRLHNGWSGLTNLFEQRCRRVPGNAVSSVDILWGSPPENPDLWGFCGGTDGVLATALPASGMINYGTLRAAHLSRSVPAWLAPPGAETHRLRAASQLCRQCAALCTDYPVMRMPNRWAGQPSCGMSGHLTRYSLMSCSRRMSACPQCWASSRST